MKRMILIAALFAAACSRAPDNLLQGYGEADYIFLAAQDGGVISQILVHEGDQVAAGARVFQLDRQRLGYSARSASASQSALAQAVDAAQADARLAARNYARSTALEHQGFVSRAQLDNDRAARDAADARLDQARRQLTAAGADTSLASERVSDLSGQAPAAGTIERVYHRPGEVVAAGAPIAALLTPANMKIKFFAPNALLSRLTPGARVTIACEGAPCTRPFRAHISRVANEPQFTPPVIYSLEQRDKLVFLVEARLDEASPIQPGMPVTVHLP